jgi:hypothetical protein
VDLGPLRTLALELNLAAHGVAATVTRPFPDNTPIETTGIWQRPLDETQPIGTDFTRREPRRVLVLPRSVLSTLPRGTTIGAPELAGGPVLAWRVDGLDRANEPDTWRAILTRV